jgi:hypothetical protein
LPTSWATQGPTRPPPPAVRQSAHEASSAVTADIRALQDEVQFLRQQNNAILETLNLLLAKVGIPPAATTPQWPLPTPQARQAEFVEVRRGKRKADTTKRARQASSSPSRPIPTPDGTDETHRESHQSESLTTPNPFEILAANDEMHIAPQEHSPA